MRAYDGWLKAQGVDSKSGAPTDDEFEAAVRQAASG